MMKFTTRNHIFEVNIRSKLIRRSPDNIPGAWKSFSRMSTPKIGFPMMIVWETDEHDNAKRSILTSPIVSVSYSN